MKPRVGVYLTKRTSAKLTTVAKRRGMTKSALVEAALNHFLDGDGTSEAVTLTDRFADLSGQIGQLDRDLGIVSEIVALHARFHLAVTPDFPSAAQDSACKRGSARFDEFASQVGRRLQHGTSLLQETIDRLDTRRSSASADSADERSPMAVGLAADGADAGASSEMQRMPERVAAVREDGSNFNFPIQRRRPLH
jgi:hypothetical protein